MSSIRPKNTNFEKTGFSILMKAGFRYRRHPKGIVGNPDAANKSKKIAVFFDSDFWHGVDYDNWKHKLNDYWQSRIEKNIARDVQVNQKLFGQGWKTLRLSETDLKKKKIDSTVQKICIFADSSQI